MSKSIKTEAIVLRSIRFGEADRILHLYTPLHGQVSAIAKGIRRARSRFGGRLEPLSHVNLVLYIGRSDIRTVTAVDTVKPYRRLRAAVAPLESAGKACSIVARLFANEEPHPEVFNLLANELSLLDCHPDKSGEANIVAFALKLSVVAGFVPHLASCASCGSEDHITGFSAAAGGVTCSACEANSFSISEETHRFLVTALATPLAQLQEPNLQSLRQASRAIAQTLEYHAGVRFSTQTLIRPSPS